MKRLERSVCDWTVSHFPGLSSYEATNGGDQENGPFNPVRGRHTLWVFQL